MPNKQLHHSHALSTKALPLPMSFTLSNWKQIPVQMLSHSVCSIGKDQSSSLAGSYRRYDVAEINHIVMVKDVAVHG
jgi:hypothetical protein